MIYKVIHKDIFVPRGFGGITIAPFIFLRENQKGNTELIEHEKVHIRQQYKWFILPFFIMYVFSTEWRQKWELEAFRVSVQHGLPVNTAARWLSTKYDLHLSYRQAKRLLTLQK